ncbi:MAG TPA: nickel/cobalt efflux protein RcnA [Planctomycetota bacterium]|nr:nickel/cobalt efflux protein RcnA [Planctomycetota bacterium]
MSKAVPMDVSLSYVYLPSAVMLGALHALEPGHAKTLTAAYLIGIKGTKWDAVVLGLSVAITHSAVVMGLAAVSLLVGRETFTDDAMYWLQIISGVVVVLLGSWMLWRRVVRMRRGVGAGAHSTAAVAGESGHGHAPEHEHGHDHDHDHDHEHEHGHEHGQEHEHDHDHAHDHAHDHVHAHAHGDGPGHSEEHDHELMSDDEHARAHAATMPEYAKRGERPSFCQIAAFGAAGGMIPCPASVTVMLLALSVSQTGLGALLVLGFSVGLAVMLVSIGLVVVAGLSQMASHGRLAWVTRQAPLISASMVILSGVFALVVAGLGHR